MGCRKVTARNVIRISYGIFYLQQLKLSDYLTGPFCRSLIPAFANRYVEHRGRRGGDWRTSYRKLPVVGVICRSSRYDRGADRIPPGPELDGIVVRLQQSKRCAGSAVSRGLGAQFCHWQRCPLGGLHVSCSCTTAGGPSIIQSPHQWRPAFLSALTQARVWRSEAARPRLSIQSAAMTARYKETAVHFEHRFSARSSFQINYVLAWSDGSGGNGDGARSSSARCHLCALSSGCLGSRRACQRTLGVWPHQCR